MDDMLEKETLVSPLPLSLGLFVSSVLLNRLFSGRVFPHRAARVLGWPFLSGGIVLTGWFHWTMRRNDTSVAYEESASNLVTDGPFKYSRNPGYLSTAMIHVGIAFLTNKRGAALLLPVHVLLIHYGVVKPEERYLEREFDGEYLDYKTRVRRWL